MALKQDTRASVLARRKAIPDVKRKEKSRLICERFLAEIDTGAGEAALVQCFPPAACVAALTSP